MAESSNEVISVLTVLPHVPDSSPVTGRARPSRDVYAVAIVNFLQVEPLPQLTQLHMRRVLRLPVQFP